MDIETFENPNPENEDVMVSPTPPNTVTGTIMKTATHPFDSGLATFQWPAEISADEYEDFKDWLKIIQRKVGRAVESSEPEDPRDIESP